MKGLREYLGLGLLLVVALSIVGYKVFSSSGSSSPSVSPITVTGFVGGEKLGFLNDPAVQRILHDRYGITVDATKAGSIEMVKGSTVGQDFLWPSSELALELYKQRHGSASSSIIFNSPIVLYAWKPVADALTRAGLVKQRNGIDDVTNLARLSEMIVQGKPWKSIGLNQIYGPVTIYTTDPAKSNSGFVFTGLLANTLNGGQVVDSSSLPRVLPLVKQFYDRLGYLESSSADLFDQFLKTGIGAKPMIAGYESQLIEYNDQNKDYRDLLRRNIRVLYPVPTVWTAHPLIALDPNGQRLLKALADPDLQQIAWQHHGFRSAVVGVHNDPADLKLERVPETIQAVIPLPRFAIMDRILRALSQ